MKKEKKAAIDTWLQRDLSYSSISSFEYDPEQWYRTYILGIRQESIELTFGSMVDKKLQEDPKFLPDVVRYPILQHEMRAPFAGFRLVGVADTFKRASVHYKERKPFVGPALRDYKTGKKPWDQKRADDTEQLTMYCFLLYLTEKIHPEEVDLYIDWLPTMLVSGTGGGLKNRKDFTIAFRDTPVLPFTFRTARTMSQVLAFGSKIKRVRKEMLLYASQHA